MSDREPGQRVLDGPEFEHRIDTADIGRHRARRLAGAWRDRRPAAHPVAIPPGIARIGRGGIG